MNGLKLLHLGLGWTKLKLDYAMADEKKVITIGDQEYDPDTLSDKAKTQMANIRFVLSRIRELEGELAVAQTARAGYVRALKKSLDEHNQKSGDA